MAESAEQRENLISNRFEDRKVDCLILDWGFQDVECHQAFVGVLDELDQSFGVEKTPDVLAQEKRVDAEVSWQARCQLLPQDRLLDQHTVVDINVVTELLRPSFVCWILFFEFRIVGSDKVDVAEQKLHVSHVWGFRDLIPLVDTNSSQKWFGRAFSQVPMHK